MIEHIRSLLVDALNEREGAEAKVTAILDAVEAEDRTDLTPEETIEFDAARAERVGAHGARLLKRHRRVAQHL